MHTENQSIHQFQHSVEASYQIRLLHAALLISGTETCPIRTFSFYFEMINFMQDQQS